MQCGQYQVVGFGECDGVVYVFVGMYFVDYDYVWCLVQGVFQCGFLVVGIDVDFVLGDDVVFVFVYEFDWVFDGDDVFG